MTAAMLALHNLTTVTRLTTLIIKDICNTYSYIRGDRLDSKDVPTVILSFN
jgi:hypothetical protein